MNTSMYNKKRLPPRTETDAAGSSVERLSKTVRFTVDGVEIEVPSVAYVRKLEKSVEEQGKLLRALGAASRTHRNTLRSQQRTIQTVQHDLGGKLDHPSS